jgi:hypothetical protein
MLFHQEEFPMGHAWKNWLNPAGSAALARRSASSASAAMTDSQEEIYQILRRHYLHRDRNVMVAAFSSLPHFAQFQPFDLSASVVSLRIPSLQELEEQEEKILLFDKQQQQQQQQNKTKKKSKWSRLRCVRLFYHFYCAKYGIKWDDVFNLFSSFSSSSATSSSSSSSLASCLAAVEKLVTERMKKRQQGQERELSQFVLVSNWLGGGGGETENKTQQQRDGYDDTTNKNAVGVAWEIVGIHKSHINNNKVTSPSFLSFSFFICPFFLFFIIIFPF